MTSGMACAASQKRQELVNFGTGKSVRGCACVCMCLEHIAASAALARAEGTGSGRCGCSRRRCLGSEAIVTNGVSSIHAGVLPNCKALLSNKIPAEIQTEIKTECKGKIPKSHLQARALRWGGQHCPGCGGGSPPGGRPPGRAVPRARCERTSGPKSGL